MPNNSAQKIVIFTIIGFLIITLAIKYMDKKTSRDIGNFGNEDAARNQNQDDDKNGAANSNSSANSIDEKSATIITENLYVPWSMAFMAADKLLVTGRDGVLTVVHIGKGMKSEIPVADVAERGEGGLLGLALHPDFINNKYIYLYFTARGGPANEKTINKVMRYVFDGTRLTDEKVIVDNIPGGTNHNGGRIEFGPDKLLYVTTGDGGNENLAQDTKSLAGKILRVTDEGAIPADNPFGNAVYSYGHRNPQGLAWDSLGNLWETEHGRSGIQSGFDEINLIQKGANYGWPIIQGDETKAGMRGPVLHSGATTTWAPSGIAYSAADNSLYFAGLRGEALYRIPILKDAGELENEAPRFGPLEKYFDGNLGRLRGVTVGPDSALYISTSNRDGRGTIEEGDDLVVKVEVK